MHLHKIVMSEKNFYDTIKLKEGRKERGELMRAMMTVMMIIMIKTRK